MFEISKLLEYGDITIQCHDVPDADTIASGFALYTYFKAHNKNVRLIYSGRFTVSKPNLTAMINDLNIPLEYLLHYKTDGLLITVDCQYGAGNVTKFDAATVAIIDHHQQEIYNIPAQMTHILPYLGCCSTAVWQLLMHAGFNLKQYTDVSTALYYGLFTDTNSMAEISHPLDKDMWDSLSYDNSIIRKLRNSNLSINDLEIASTALQKHSIDTDNKFALFRAHPCDPNILGFISDLALQVDTVETCIVYCETAGGYKISVRSCVREVMANELAAFITEGIGSGGGHIEKAGGFISQHSFDKKYPGSSVSAYFLDRIRFYFDSFDVIYSDNHSLDTSKMSVYQKLPLKLGYVPVCDVFPQGTPVLVRTLECDMDIVASADINIMIGIKGEAYPIKHEKFNKSYHPEACEYTADFQYFPTIRNRVTGEAIDLKPYVKPCISTGSSRIYAAKLTKNTKVFTAWDKTRYMYGKPGDYIGIRCDDPHDVYIVEASIFAITYEAL